MSAAAVVWVVVICTGCFCLGIGVGEVVYRRGGNGMSWMLGTYLGSLSMVTLIVGVLAYG